MSTQKSLPELLSPAGLAEVDVWIAKYPAEQRQSAVMAALRIAQEEHHNWLDQEHMDAIALYLDMPAIAVYEVASFYSMYHLKPMGKKVISVCTNISCQLCGCDSIVSQLEHELGIKLGETTADGRFSLKPVECLGACVDAPVLDVDKTYHGRLTSDKVTQLVADLNAQLESQNG